MKILMTSYQNIKGDSPAVGELKNLFGEKNVVIREKSIEKFRKNGRHGPPIGASANVTGIGILRKEGYNVKNGDYFRIGIPFTLSAIIPAYIYIWLIFGPK